MIFEIPREFDVNTQFVESIAYGNGTYVAAGSTPFQEGHSSVLLAQGTDLGSLQRIDSQVKTPSLDRLTSNGQIIVALGKDGSALIASTNNGRSFFRPENPGGTASLNAVQFGNDGYVVVGAGGTVLRSTDGVSWRKRLSNTSSDLSAVAFGNQTWVAVGANGKVITSPDASRFTLRNSGTEVPLNDVTYGNSRFVAVGASGAILSSSTGETWSIKGMDDALDLYAVAFGNGRFVAIGTNGVVSVSTNGSDWTSLRISGAGSLARVAFANGRFIALEGQSVTAYLSENGLDWTPISLPRTVNGIDSSSDTFWITGELAYIAKARFSAPSTITLQARADANRLIHLLIGAPTPGNYEVLTSPTVIGGSWNAALTISNIDSSAEVTITNHLESARFFIVRQK
jgi:hypothetical protein